MARLWSRAYLEDEAVGLVLGILGGQPVLVLGGDVDLVTCQRVADLAELLDFGLEHLLKPLVLQLGTFHLLSQLCRRRQEGVRGQVRQPKKGQ